MVNKGDVMSHFIRFAGRAAVALAAGGVFWTTAAIAQPMGYADHHAGSFNFFNQILGDRAPAGSRSSVMVEENAIDATDVPANLRRRVVSYQGNEAPGTIVIDTPNTYLYFVLGGGKAMRYGIGVGREGFTWSGVQTIVRKTEWPDWIPPQEMLQRQPYLPRFMAGGPGNPLGARAMYLGNTVYRIHGTNAPQTIGHQVSSGCIRMLNDDVTDLYARVQVGTKVVVLPMHQRHEPAIARTVPGRSAAIAPAAAVATGPRPSSLY